MSFFFSFFCFNNIRKRRVYCLGYCSWRTCVDLPDYFGHRRGSAGARPACAGTHVVSAVSARRIVFLWEKSKIFIPARSNISLDARLSLSCQVRSKRARGGRLVQRCSERSSGGRFRRRRSNETSEDKLGMTDDFKRRKEWRRRGL